MALATRLFLVALLATGIVTSAHAADTPDTRLLAAQCLFDLPTYRQLATRQIHAALKFLPAEEYRRAAEALAEVRG